MAVISASCVISPVGQNTLQTFTSVQARISRRSEREGIYNCIPDDSDFPPDEIEPVVVSALVHMDRYRESMPDSISWLAYMAAQAILDMEPASAMKMEDNETWGLFLSLPSAYPGWGPDRQEEFLYYFSNYLKRNPFHYQEFSYSGHAGALLLLESALRSMQRGMITRALVGGVESYIVENRLRELDQTYRLKSRRNVGGFTPGEGVAFILLEMNGQPERRGLAAQVRIEKSGSMHCEPAELVHNTGSTLSRLISEILDSMKEVPVFLCDLNGEPSRMKEWGYVLSRLGTRLGVPCLYEHPVTSLGDMGAASGALLLALSFHYLNRKHTEKDHALIWAASDGGDRAAVMVSIKTQKS